MAWLLSATANWESETGIEEVEDRFNVMQKLLIEVQTLLI